MTSLKDLQNILLTTEPPQQLLHIFPNGKATPLYMYEALTRLNKGNYHRGVRKNILIISFISQCTSALFLRGETCDQSGKESSGPGWKAASVRWGLQEHWDRQQFLRGGARLPQAERRHPPPQHLREGEWAGLRQAKPLPLQKQRTWTSQSRGDLTPPPSHFSPTHSR